MMNSIDFLDHIVEKFPYRIETVRTDNGHEFHWRLEKDLGINHVYIKPISSYLNRKVERSLGTD